MFKCKYTEKKREKEIEKKKKKKLARPEIRTANRLHVNHV